MSVMTNFSTGSVRRGFVLSEVSYLFYYKNFFVNGYYFKIVIRKILNN